MIEEKQKYEKFQKMRTDIINESNQPKSSKKTKKSTNKEGLASSLKKMKIDSTKPTPGTTPFKSNAIEEEVENSSPLDGEKRLTIISPTKKDPATDSKSKLEQSAKAKNNKLLTQFFVNVKKPQSEQKKPLSDQTADSKEKSIFKCLGIKHIRSQWTSDREQQFQLTLSGSNPITQVEMLVAKLRSKYGKEKPSKTPGLMEMVTVKSRKIYVNIQDSFRRIKGRFDKDSSLVNGRNPFARDPQVDYDMDSEEEYENQFADNLDDDDAEDKDEDDEEDEDEDNFIVPDGYLSSEELHAGHGGNS